MKHKLVLMTFLIFVFVFGAGSSAKAPWLDSGLYERNDGGYFTIQDSQGEVITYAARILDRGDSYIAADNQRYEVVAVVDDLITVERKETIELPDVGVLLHPLPHPVSGSGCSKLRPARLETMNSGMPLASTIRTTQSRMCQPVVWNPRQRVTLWR